MSSDKAAHAYLVRIPVSDRAGPYACHQRVYEVCGREARPLWRRCPSYVLALSRSEPQGFPKRAFRPAPRIGQSTRFDLLAEAAVAKKRAGQERGRRCDPILEARIADPSRSYPDLAREFGRSWLERKGERNGFELVSLDRSDYEVLEFTRSGKPVRLGTVRLAGSLCVTDAELFASAMLNGLGHGKAWGCGFLLCFGAR
jgi:CRISPR-associated protein Cas6/Cse3/CasE subtype I-E